MLSAQENEFVTRTPIPALTPPPASASSLVLI